MGVREQFQKLIDRKQQDIKDLELQLEKARTYAQALQDSMRLLPKEFSSADREQSLRPGTALAKAREALKVAGKPMHISDILKAIGKPPDKKNKLSLSGSLSTYVRNRQIFSRPAPNTFGLIEMVKVVSDPSIEGIELPEDFGTMAGEES